MRTFLAKCLAFGLIIGGFVFTGDVARLARHASRFFNEVAVPTDAAAPPPTASPVPSFPSPATEPRESFSRSAVDAPPPAGSLDAVSLGSLRPGDRLLVWIASPASAVVAFDIVDPATGEALEQRHVAAADGSGTAVHAVPRRVVIAGSAGTGRPAVRPPSVDVAGSIVRGRAIVLAPRMLFRGDGDLGPGETLGPVQAIVVAGFHANGG